MVKKFIPSLLFLLPFMGVAALPDSIRSYPNYLQKTKLSKFIDKLLLEETELFEKQELLDLFDQVRWLPKKAEKPPAKKKAGKKKKRKLISWSRYKGSYVSQSRIDSGVAFYAKNRSLIDSITSEYEVDPKIIVAILGVETNYGAYQGKTRVLDTLANLSFNNHYRQSFFTRELKSFLILTKLHNIEAMKVYGSSAGAFGASQFMPSSYLGFAQDYNNDGKADIINDMKDIVASVSNYFQKHGWKLGEPVATDLPDKKVYFKFSTASAKKKPKHSVADWRRKIPGVPYFVDSEVKAKVIRLPEDKGQDYWLAYHNFYVISRYNHSLRYAMAVYHLALEIERIFLNAKQYKVKRGDTLGKIVRKYGSNMHQVMRINPEITNPHLIYVGQKIMLPSL